jgi:accessory gene regulator protein AgrB
MEEDDREVLAFVLFQIFALMQQLIIFSAVAIVLDAFIPTFAFILFFASIKRYAGGAHAGKHWVCLTISTGLLIAVCLLSKVFILPPYVIVSMSLATLTLVLLKAPVIHPNNPKPERRRKKMRKTSIYIAAAQCALIVTGSCIWPVTALPGALGGLAAAVTLVITVPTGES